MCRSIGLENSTTQKNDRRSLIFKSGDITLIHLAKLDISDLSSEPFRKIEGLLYVNKRDKEYVQTFLKVRSIQQLCF